MASGVGKAIGKVFKAPIKIAKKVVKTAWDNKEMIALAAAAYFTAGAATGAMGGTGFMAGAPGFGSTGMFTQAAGAMGFGPGAVGAAGATGATALPSLAAPGAMTPIAGAASGLSPMTVSGLSSVGSSVAQGGLTPSGVSADRAAMIQSQEKMHGASMNAANRSALLSVGGSALSSVGSYLETQEQNELAAKENEMDREQRRVYAPSGNTATATEYYRRFLERA